MPTCGPIGYGHVVGNVATATVLAPRANCSISRQRTERLHPQTTPCQLQFLGLRFSLSHMKPPTQSNQPPPLTVVLFFCCPLVSGLTPTVASPPSPVHPHTATGSVCWGQKGPCSCSRVSSGSDDLTKTVRAPQPWGGGGDPQPGTDTLPSSELLVILHHKRDFLLCSLGRGQEQRSLPPAPAGMSPLWVLRPPPT